MFIFQSLNYRRLLSDQIQLKWVEEVEKSLHMSLSTILPESQTQTPPLPFSAGPQPFWNKEKQREFMTTYVPAALVIPFPVFSEVRNTDSCRFTDERNPYYLYSEMKKHIKRSITNVEGKQSLHQKPFPIIISFMLMSTCLNNDWIERTI